MRLHNCLISESVFFMDKNFPTLIFLFNFQGGTKGPKNSFVQVIKGQLISKCPYEMTVSSKIPTKLFLDFCPEIFCSFLGASWELFGFPGDLVCNIINKEACRKPQKATRKPPGRYKKFQGRNSEIISLVILSKR